MYVGAGKTMLMDLFYSSARVAKKQRVHFMLDIHNGKLSIFFLMSGRKYYYVVSFIRYISAGRKWALKSEKSLITFFHMTTITYRL